MQNEIFNQTVSQINFDNRVREQHEHHRQFVSNSNSDVSVNTEHKEKYLAYQAEIEAMRAKIKASR